MIANTPSAVDINKLRNIINLSEEYLKNHNSIDENDWLKESDAETITRLLDKESGLPAGNSLLLDLESTTASDLIQCLKYYFRHLDFFEGNKYLIETFCNELKEVKELDPSLRQNRYQLTMQKLVDKLLKQEDIVRVYCLHEILYLIHTSLTPTESSDSVLAPRITATVAPMFQEAFGVSQEPEFIPLFFEAFAHIIRDKKYKEPFHKFYTDLDPTQTLKQLQFEEDRDVEEMYLEENHSLEEILSEINSATDDKGNEKLEISGVDKVMFSKKPDKSQLEELDNTKDKGDVVSEGVDKKLETRAEVKPPVSVPRKAEVHIKAKSSDSLKGVRINKEAVESAKKAPKTQDAHTAGQKFKFYASATGQKLKTAWQYSKPKIIQFWHFTIRNIKAFVIWLWPKIKRICKQIYAAILNGTKKLYQGIKTRMQKKND